MKLVSHLAVAPEENQLLLEFMYSGYNLANRKLDDALSEVHSDIVKVSAALEEALNERFSFLVGDPVMKAAAIILDTDLILI